jgi:putative ABC transport system ATP-binding protein
MIRTRGLAYTYASSSVVLRFPDVDLRQGGTLLLRGRSGSGKSTWLALMAGLRGAGSGDLFVAGTQLGMQRGSEIDAWRARSIGFLPQKLYLSSALTVADNLGLVYFAAGLPRDEAAIGRALAQVVLDVGHRGCCRVLQRGIRHQCGSAVLDDATVTVSRCVYSWCD